MASNSFRSTTTGNSITERWMERVAQTEGLEHVMQQWCQREVPAIQDLKVLAPCVFANECCTTPDGEMCSSTMCKAVMKLKAECQSFIECKDAYAVARVAHADALKKLDDNQTQPDQHDVISLEPLASIHAKLVAVTETIVSKDAQAFAAKVQMIFDRHFGVRIMLQALRASRNKTSLVLFDGKPDK